MIKRNISTLITTSLCALLTLALLSFSSSAHAQGWRDITDKLVNPHFAEGTTEEPTGWVINSGSLSELRTITHNVEAYHRTFDISQTLTGLPAGIYMVTFQGFVRYDNGEVTGQTWAYVNNGHYRLIDLNNNVRQKRTTPLFSEGLELFGDNNFDNSYGVTEDNEGNPLYQCNGMTGGYYWFQETNSQTGEPYYTNRMSIRLYENSDLTIGVHCESETDWVLLDNFRLYVWEDASTSVFSDENLKAAQSVIEGHRYRIWTYNNGFGKSPIKYYLTSEGTLTPDRESAGAYPLTLVQQNINLEGGDIDVTSFKFNIGYPDSQVAFTNAASSSWNGPHDNQGFIRHNSMYRDDFEAQVFFLGKSGNYAIRATAAKSENWGANSYWTTYDSNGDFLPEADYGLTPNYIWRLEDMENPLTIENDQQYVIQQKASGLYFGLDAEHNRIVLCDKTVTAEDAYQVDLNSPLVSSVAQLSSPWTESTEGSLEALLDGDNGTFWHSVWSSNRDGVPVHTHYLQVDLQNGSHPLVAMRFTRRPATNDHITQWGVFGSDDPNASDDAWVNLASLETPFKDNTETLTTKPFYTQGKRYLRFYIDNTTGANGASRGYGHMSEFQLYAVSQQSPTSVLSFVPTDADQWKISDGVAYVGLIGGWNMNVVSEESAVPFTFDPQSLDGTVYYLLKEQNGCVGTDNTTNLSPCYSDKNTGSSDRIYWTVTVYDGQQFGPQEEVLEQVIAVQRPVGQGYTATYGEVDFTETKAFLGVSELNTDMLYFINPDGTEIPWSSYSAVNYDGWCNAEGGAQLHNEGEGGLSRICVKFFQAITDGRFSIHDMHGADVVGKTYTVRWALKQGHKTVRYTINVTFSAFAPTVVQTITRYHTEYAGIALNEEEENPTFSVDDVCKALGIDNIQEAKAYIVNMTTGEFVPNTTDGWRDANGDACPYEQATNGFCLKLDDPSSGQFNYTGAHDANFVYNDMYYAQWGLVANGKAVIIKVRVRFIKSQLNPKDIEITYGQKIPTTFDYELAEGRVVGDVPKFVTTATSESGVGTYSIKAEAGSYDSKLLSVATGTLTIKPATLKARPKDVSRAWGQPNPTFTIQYSGFVKGESQSSVVTEAPVATCEATETSAPGEYPVILTGGKATNYDVVCENGKLTVTEPITVTVISNGSGSVVLNGTRVRRATQRIEVGAGIPLTFTFEPLTNYKLGSLYRDNVNALLSVSDNSYTYTARKDFTLLAEFVKEDQRILTIESMEIVYGEAIPTTFQYVTSGEALVGTPKFETTATKASGVGEYPISLVSGSINTDNVVVNSGTLTIKPAQLTAKVQDVTRNWGVDNPEFAVKYSGFVKGENESVITKAPVVACQATSSSPAGAYPIELSGGEAANYEFVYEAGTLTVKEPYTFTVISSGNGTVKYKDKTIRNSSFTFKESTPGQFEFELAANDGYELVSLTQDSKDVLSKVENNRYLSSYKQTSFTLVASFEPILGFTVDDVTYDVTNTASHLVAVARCTKGGDVVLPTEVSHGALTYKVRGVKSGAFSGNTELRSVTFPRGIYASQVGSNLFAGCSALGAIIWNILDVMPDEAFDIPNENLLVYVMKADYAPSGVTNVVVDGVAPVIKLNDGITNPFYCPQEFTATQISYSHHYSMTSGLKTAQGWESIALPFDVQDIAFGSVKLVPFRKYVADSDSHPFWLYRFTTNGFVPADGIQAATPYIICMPNNPAYDPEFNIVGTVTFSSTNCKVPVSTKLNTVKRGNVTFTPAYAAITNTGSEYALNVSNGIVSYGGTENPGSRFERGLRDIYPFEAYMQGSAAAVKTFIDLEFDKAQTGVWSNEGGKWIMEDAATYSISGQHLGDGVSEQRMRSLPNGIYLKNGKKVFVKH